MKPKNVNCRKTILGKYEVTYDCPGCGESLKNDLDDAGKNDQCPYCECEFVVPGSGYKRDLERIRAERIAEKEKEAVKREAEQREAEQREAERVKAEQREAENQQAKWREADRIAREAREKLNREAESADERTPIQHISKGLAELVRAFFYSFLATFFGAIGNVLVGITASTNWPEDSGMPILLYLTAFILGMISLGYVGALFSVIPASIKAFEKGSKA